MESPQKPAGDLIDSVKEYAGLKADELKLRGTEGLSTALGKIFSMIAMMTVASTALICAAFGFVLLIGRLLGDYAAGAFIVAGVFIIVFALMYAFRNRMFVNTFVRLFIKLFYDNERL